MQKPPYLQQTRVRLAAFSLCGAVISACSSPSPIGMLAPSDSSAWNQCGQATKVKIKAPESTITVSYSEPTVGTDGKPLEKLARTTIYVDGGGGPMIAKIVPATKPSGGGKISEQVTLSVKDAEKEVAICITATDSENREGPATP
ncbi:MAG: hypothetical protein NW701_06680 [Nitrospira sp.]